MKIGGSAAPRAIDNAETGELKPAAGAPAIRAAVAAARNETAPAAVPAQRYNRWALMGYAQQKIADAQASEQLLTQTYRQLQQAGRQLANGANAGGAVTRQLRALDAHLQAYGHLLNGALQPKQLDAAARQQRYVLDKIDLTAPKHADERVQMVFPASGRGVSIDIPAASADADVAARLQQALAGERIDVDYREGQLVFGVSFDERRKLDEPILISGQGVRVPAGNPIPLKLQPAPTELDALAGGIERSADKGEIALQQQRLQKLMRSIEGSIRDLQAYRERIMAQLQRAKTQVAAVSDEQLQKIQEQLLGDLRGADFSASWSALVAQANTSRDTVTALLNA